ncbi:glutaminase A [Caulobacter mirabilis]|uniref:Glutaminase n=1 Tax=Caulobacter mirabilis TaxID=69666 RepID=A0A2D2B1B7_9CAUL|nr:glutaminase A [Caulobacter mirabilis]ATQ44032.1 glutaminase [Caulobacter mirabilis]
MPVLTASRRDLAKGLALFGLAGAAPAVARAKPKPAADTVSLPAAEAAVKAAYERYRGLNEGKNADYIPALAKVPSQLFGIALVTPHGQVVAAGDVGHAFSIQSISKVFTLAQVLQESGEQLVEDAVGVDATGQAFNSIVAVEQHRGREMNPLVNPGAIAATGLVKGDSADAVWASISRMHDACAGRTLSVDAEVYRSESETNQRNRAIAMLMSAYERFPGDPAQAVDLYTRGCSIAANARDLAVMAATLANGGRNPITRTQAIDNRHIPGLLAVMATAGLYDDSGKWLFRTGLPAKSGVGGGLIAVAPGRFGVAAFSPPLDAAGNSVRAQKAIIDICRDLGANPYAVTPV